MVHSNLALHRATLCHLAASGSITPTGLRVTEMILLFKKWLQHLKYFTAKRWSPLHDSVYSILVSLTHKEGGRGRYPAWTTTEPRSFARKSCSWTNGSSLQRKARDPYQRNPLSPHQHFKRAADRNKLLKQPVIPWVTAFLSHNFLNEVTSHTHWRTKRQENT